MVTGPLLVPALRVGEVAVPEPSAVTVALAPMANVAAPEVTV